jgi:hypothetical protein
MVLTFAAPVLLGMILNEAALPPLQSFEEGPSTVFWVAGSVSGRRIVRIICIHPLLTRWFFLFFSKKKKRKKRKSHTCNRVNSGHKSLNDAKSVMNDLQF